MLLIKTIGFGRMREEGIEYLLRQVLSEMAVKLPRCERERPASQMSDSRRKSTS